MHVIELRYPGTWVFRSSHVPSPSQAPDPADIELGNLIRKLESLLNDAALALNLYEAGIQTQAHRANSVRAAMQSIRENGSVENIGAAFNAGPSFPGIEGAPRSQQDRYPFMCARAFLFAIDMILKMFGRISSNGHLNASGQSIYTGLQNALPGIRLARNSSAHLEDRIVRMGLRGAAISPSPISNSMVSAPNGGVLMLENLIGNKFGSTDQNGNLSEVELSAATLQAAVNAVQALIDSYTWR